MLASTINLTIFIMMIIVYLNEMKNISMFIFNFNYIKDLSKIIMNDKCNNIYCEAETDRYQIAKNSYNLLLPNDIFNSKTYIIFTFIITIMIFIYYYYLLFDSEEGNSYYYALHILLLAILLSIIIYRYVPDDDSGYLNYFAKVNDNDSYFDSFKLWILTLFLAITYVTYQLKRKQLNDEGVFINSIKFLSFILSIVIVINLMNIVMTFRNNTKPILKTKHLIWSLENSFNSLKDKGSKEEIDELDDIIKILQNLRKQNDLTKYKNYIKSSNISSAINYYIAFNELSKIKESYIDNNTNTNKYITDLIKIKENNYTNLKGIIEDTSNSTTLSDISLIFDKTVKIPYDYDNKGNAEHLTNNNHNNTDYIYTADISYGNSNLFYEKYWDMNDNDETFLYKYDYFTPTFLFGGNRPNLIKIVIVIILFIIIIYILNFFVSFIYKNTTINFSELYRKTSSETYPVLFPLYMLIIFIVFIILFIRFNTKFNANVVYKCLDCSYKRSLNKLNNITTPYIRMYDNKIIKGNKNYINHYIISNVFYSILSGNIKLYDNSDTTLLKDSIINEEKDNEIYYDIKRIKSNRLKFTNINNSILNNDNEFREYYKGKFDNIYNDTYELKSASKIYNVFKHIFKTEDNIKIMTEIDIDNYFNSDIITRDNIYKIYCIIKKCMDLFNEEKFNNNLIYYNNYENKQKGINIDDYNKFKFYKYNDKIIPYKFILKLNNNSEYNDFVKDRPDAKLEKVAADAISTDKAATAAAATTFNINIKNYFDIDVTPFTSVTSASSLETKKLLSDILLDSDEENLTVQASDMEKLQDKNLIKLISKYLLILGHINYNRIEYNTISNKNLKKEIYEKKTYYLYKLISNILYDETYEIDDTFNGSGVGSVKRIKITNEGSGYTITPTITFESLLGNGANAEAVFKPTSVNNIKLLSGGSGYTSIPKVTISGGGSIGEAVAKAKVYEDTLDPSKQLQLMHVTNGGSGYTSVPIVKFEEIPLAISATAIAILNPTSIDSITVTNGGSGYTSIPKVTISGGGSGVTINAEAEAITTLLINSEKYKKLTYIYNYLETKYVNISSNNNKNYLMNIIKSINNKINDDDKILNTESKEAQYLFRKNIDDIKNPKEYDNEENILNIANSVSTSSLAVTYIFNIILLIIYFNIISMNNIK